MQTMGFNERTMDPPDLVCRPIYSPMLPRQISNLARLRLPVIARRVRRPPEGIEMPPSAGAVSVLWHWQLVKIVVYFVRTIPKASRGHGTVEQKECEARLHVL